jgi:hypothetical protein
MIAVFAGAGSDAFGLAQLLEKAGFTIATVAAPELQAELVDAGIQAEVMLDPSR